MTTQGIFCITDGVWFHKSSLGQKWGKDLRLNTALRRYNLRDFSFIIHSSGSYHTYPLVLPKKEVRLYLEESLLTGIHHQNGFIHDDKQAEVLFGAFVKYS